MEKTNIKSPFTGGEVILMNIKRKVDFRDEKDLEVEYQVFSCVDTGHTFTTTELDSDYMWKVFRAYCERKGIEYFSEIQLIESIEENVTDAATEYAQNKNKICGGNIDITSTQGSFVAGAEWVVEQLLKGNKVYKEGLSKILNMYNVV